jgi:hypothetical protein
MSHLETQMGRTRGHPAQPLPPLPHTYTLDKHKHTRTILALYIPRPTHLCDMLGGGWEVCQLTHVLQVLYDNGAVNQDVSLERRAGFEITSWMVRKFM